MAKPPERKPPGPTPSPDSRTKTFSVRVSAAEIEEIEKAAKKLKEPAARAWIRDEMLKLARRVNRK